MFTKIKNRIKEFGIFNLIVLIVFAIFIIFAALHHEAYEDEAQSWLIARDLSPLGVLKQLRFEGHSPLWYFIIMPFAKLGFPIVSQSIISSLFAIATAYLILKKIDCNKFYKLLFIFNGGMLFWFSIIARPYCMVPFLLILISIYYKDRNNHPYIYSLLLALLCQTHLIMLPTAFLLAIDYYGNRFVADLNINKKQMIKGFIIFIFSLIMMCTIVLIAKNACKITDMHIDANKISNFSELNYKIKQTMNTSMKILYGGREVPIFFYNLVFISLAFIFIGSFQTKKQAIIFWGQFLFVFLVHSFYWFALPSRVYMVIITMIFWMCNYKYDVKNDEKNVMLEMGVVLFIICTSLSIYKLSYQDIKGNYSTGKVTAKYIEKNIPKDSIFICVESELQQSIIAYLNKGDYHFYMPDIKKNITYVTFDSNWADGVKSEEVNDAIEKYKDKNIYLLAQSKQKQDFLELKYDSEKEIINNYYPRYEQYKIYKIDSDKFEEQLEEQE